MAPQRIIGAGERWRPLRLDVGSRDLSLDYPGFVDIDVDARGQVTAVDLDLDREVTRDVRADLVGRFEKACLVPGLTRAGPAAMRYRERVWA